MRPRSVTLFDAVSDVQLGIDRITGVDAEEIRATAEATLDEFRALDTDHAELESFLENAEYHRAVAVTILQHR